VSLDFAGDLAGDEALFSESGGFVVEVPEHRVGDVADICKRFGVEGWPIGRTIAGHSLAVTRAGRVLVRLAGDIMHRAFFEPLERRAR
jgi:hypothetical protein